ncbi:MAG: hypothetical protein ACRD2D_10095, partial [Terriglobales bacterium]
MMHTSIARAVFAAIAAAFLLIPAGSSAQSTPAQSAPAQITPAQSAQSWHPENAYWKSHDEQMLNDFPWLARFRAVDAKLSPPSPGEDRVVFMGDSITE